LGKEDKDDELAGRERPRERAGTDARKHPVAADEEGEDEPRSRDELEPREKADSDPDRSPVGLVVVPRDVLDAAGLEALGGGGFDHLDAAEVVLESGVHVADAGADGGVLRLDRRDEQVGEDGDQRHRRERDQRELWVERDEIYRDGEYHHRQAERGVQPVVEKALELVDVVREDRHEFAGLLVGEKVHVQLLHRVVGVGADVVLDVLGEGVEAVVAEPVKARAEDERTGDEADDEEELCLLGRREPRPRHQRELEGFDPLKQAVDGDAEQHHG